MGDPSGVWSPLAIASGVSAIVSAVAAVASACAAKHANDTATRSLATTESVAARDQRDRWRPVALVVRDDAGKWVLRCVGYGAAVNMVVAIKGAGGAWAVRGVYSPVLPGQWIELPWAVGSQPEDEVGAVYEDVLGGRYHTILSGRYGHRIEEGDHAGIRNARTVTVIADELQAHGEVRAAHLYEMLAHLDYEKGRQR